MTMLRARGKDQRSLLLRSNRIREGSIGPKVHFRGLVEFSNICRKDCYYCGIRKSNNRVERYNLTDVQILEAARFAHENRYGSLVLQSGEVRTTAFSERIERLLQRIKRVSGGTLGITLSLGEQDEETYLRWFEAGAHRYLLRIETSSPGLYKRLHPSDHTHRFEDRFKALKNLQSIGYQTGTGVMIGLPFQEPEHLAEDLLFMKDLDIDMVGMGPYLEHRDTPLYRYRDRLLPVGERLDLTLNMIAVLRILMPDINIAAATALQAIDPMGREKALKAGANILMPNITPGTYRIHYSLYENKPCIQEEPDSCTGCLDTRIRLQETEIGYGEWGDSRHYLKRAGT